jgi:hypothetical protein
VQNNATMLRFVRITLSQDEILRSGQTTCSLNEEEPWLMTSRSGGANALRQAEFKEKDVCKNKQAKTWKQCLRMSNS